MFISNKETGLLVYPEFDSGNYMGTFVIHHKELKYLNHNDTKFKVLQLAIASAVSIVLDNKTKDNK